MIRNNGKEKERAQKIERRVYNWGLFTQMVSFKYNDAGVRLGIYIKKMLSQDNNLPWRER